MSRPSQQADTTPITDDELPRLFDRGRFPVGAYILAVSGGADSMAMMHLFARHLNSQPQAPGEPGVKNRPVTVVSIDHGLRDEAKRECKFVRDTAQGQGFEHVTLTWDGDKPQTGLQAAARAARLELLKAFALRQQQTASPVVIMMAHNKNDQAETVLMRLARGSGVDGLQAMQHTTPLSSDRKIMLVRPLLDISRSRLEATLCRDGLSWTEDPSNSNTGFERVRLRTSGAAREALNLSNDALARTARRAQQAHAAIAHYVRRCVNDNVAWNRGAIAQINHPAISEPPELVTLEVISRVLSAMTASKVPISLAKLEDLTSRLRHDLKNGEKPRTATLAGCMIEYVSDLEPNDTPDKGAPTAPGRTAVRTWDGVLIYREAGRLALSPVPISPGQTVSWADTLNCTLPTGAKTKLEVRALGIDHFAALCEAAGIPKPALLRRAAPTLPSLWHNARLVSVPHLDYVDPGWSEPLATLEPWPDPRKMEL